jgi:uncharacterized protein (TIGR02271 family)
MTQMTLERILEFKGKPVLASEGDKIGSVEEIFLDEETQEPEWIGLGTGFFGMKRVLVPVQGSTFESAAVRVPYAKDKVKGAPDYDDNRVSQETEQRLYEYYGLRYSTRPSSTGLPEGGTPMQGTGGTTGRDSQTMTRSEEELRVGKREVPAGQVRMRKFVEEKPVTADVELRKETARIEREPINKPVGPDAGIGEQEIAVNLQREEPVAQEQAVAKEKVRIRKDEEKQKQSVQDTVRKERIEEDPSGRDRSSEHRHTDV